MPHREKVPSLLLVPLTLAVVLAVLASCSPGRAAPGALPAADARVAALRVLRVAGPDRR